ncbi:MAG: NHLP bacteriocin export ABC transporter permease/ATPase subunit [Ardenticatenaceae bacterium]|nr:NHLP bacteriocin export ABC transporter permease/ATPase subunit [Ardenticatenaceae bacterium]
MKIEETTLNETEETMAIEELFLMHLRYKEAKLVEAGGNSPVLLDDTATSWVVYRGWVDIFAVPLQEGQISGPRTHLFRCPAGEALFGIQQAIDLDSSAIGLLAVGGKKTSLLQIPTQRLQALGQDPEFGPQIVLLLEKWVNHFLNYLMPFLPPKDCLRLGAGDSIRLGKHKSACSRRGLLWVKHEVGHSQFAGDMHLPKLNGVAHWPISERSWILATESSVLALVDTNTLLSQKPAWPDLHHFHYQVLLQIGGRLETNKENDAQRVQAKLVSDREVVHQAFDHLLQPLLFKQHVSLDEPLSPEPLLQICQLVAQELHIKIKHPAPEAEEGGISLASIARASHFQMRQVALKGSWWRRNSGPLLGFLDESNQPVALLFTGKGYKLHTSQDEDGRFITEELAQSINAFAYMFYRPLPVKALSAWDLVQFGLQTQRANIGTIFKVGVAVGLLSLLVPLVTGYLFDQAIPSGEQNLVFQICAYLVGSIVAITLLQVMQNFAVLKLQSQLGLEIQAAVWARALSLPVSFFRNYSAGDLGSRILGISAIQQMLSGTVLGALLSGLFSIFSFFLLFYYDQGLALLASFLVAITAVVIFSAGRLQIKYQRIVAELQGRLTGSVLQAIEGIAKFRASGSEGHAFAVWAKDFSRMKSLNFKARNITTNQQTFNAGFQVLTITAIFAMIAFSTRTSLTTGQVLAFNAAFTQFLLSVLALSGALVAIFNTVPIYERAKPIFQTLPEIDEQKRHPGKLAGHIEVANVTFRYSEESPDVLKGVSLEIEPGEFVAIVGPSGSGKSTLFRMLLGFEMPQKGTIYFDGQDIKQVDLRELRRQIGVVLQNGQITAGDIFSNIKGESNLTLNDAWHAAKMAGLDRDIKMMPMGMHTVLSHGGGTLSGGQRQRLLIARAIVHRPRLLFFDEATSALDNRTQAVVSESLDNLQATRLVIAHRLSTIKNADKIIVMQDGQIVQQGTYAELIKQEGLFLDLAKRQIV